MTEKIGALRLNGDEYINPLEDKGCLTRNLALEEVELAEPGAGEVLAEPLFVGVCGSDSSASLGKPNFSWVQRPRTIGHECSARIVGFGPGTEGVGGLKLGDLVTPIPQLGCRDPRCRGCRQGRWNYCRRKRILGFHRDGALARRMVCEADRLVPLRPGLTPLQGAVVEPLSVVVQALTQKCHIQPGMDVVVTGCGIIGFMAAELARAARPGRHYRDRTGPRSPLEARPRPRLHSHRRVSREPAARSAQGGNRSPGRQPVRR